MILANLNNLITKKRLLINENYIKEVDALVMALNELDADYVVNDLETGYTEFFIDPLESKRIKELVR